MNIYLLHFFTIFEHRTACRQLSVSTRESAKFTYTRQVLKLNFLKSKASNAIFADFIFLIFISF